VGAGSLKNDQLTDDDVARWLSRGDDAQPADMQGNSALR